jgi:hypothetical protein
MNRGKGCLSLANLTVAASTISGEICVTLSVFVRARSTTEAAAKEGSSHRAAVGCGKPIRSTGKYFDVGKENHIKKRFQEDQSKQV